MKHLPALPAFYFKKQDGQINQARRSSTDSFELLSDFDGLPKVVSIRRNTRSSIRSEKSLRDKRKVLDSS